MKLGMLWYDKQGTLIERVQRAAKYYRGKYGEDPNICFVNPKTIEGTIQVGGVTVCATRSIMPGHLWIGVRDEPQRN